MRLIDKDKFLEMLHAEPVGKLLCNAYNLDGVVEATPTVDVVPVRHGRWECGDKYENAVCSVCGYDTGEAYGFGYGTGCYNFCPNCGADMRKDGEHEEAD